MSWLAGHKTYYVAGAMIILAGLHAQGYVNDNTYETMKGILMGGGLAFLRMGMKRTQAP